MKIWIFLKRAVAKRSIFFKHAVKEKYKQNISFDKTIYAIEQIVCKQLNFINVVHFSAKFDQLNDYSVRRTSYILKVYEGNNLRAFDFW